MDTEEAVKIIYANWPSENYTMLKEALEYLIKKNGVLESALIDERANYLDTLKRNPNCSAWTLDERSPEEQNKLRQDAANTLSLEEPLVYVELEEARKQIGILKGKLIEERAKLMRIYDEPSSLLTLNDDYLSMAYLQLKEQIREVNWDGND